MDKDQQHLRVAPESAALLIIDAQNDFCHPHGRQAQLGRDISRQQAVLNRIETLAEAARSAGVPVIFVKNTHSEDTDTEEWLHRHTYEPNPRNTVRGTWGAELAVIPENTDWIITKHRYSAFVLPDLTELLEDLRRNSLLFCGFTTNTCVESSLREAVVRDYLGTLVQDCSGDFSEEAHNRSVAVIAEKFGRIMDSPDIVRIWIEAKKSTADARR